MGFSHYIEDLVQVIEAVGVAILVVGGAWVLIHSALLYVVPANRQGLYDKCRRHLGHVILLGLEVPEEGSAGHPGGADYFVDGHPFETTIKKEAECGVGDLGSRSGFVAFPESQALEIPHGSILLRPPVSDATSAQSCNLATSC